MNRINIEFSIEIERVLPTRPQAKALIGSRPACPYPCGGGGEQNQGHKDDRKVCLPTVRKSKREVVGGREGGATENEILWGHATESRNWVSGWWPPNSCSCWTVQEQLRPVRGLAQCTFPYARRQQQWLQMVVMATAISLHRSIDERVCLSNCLSVYLTACLPASLFCPSVNRCVCLLA